MDAEIQKKLRAPFPAEAVGKLPRVTCRDCSQRSCQKHQKSKCQVCGNWISTQHIHLDYVGHAAITDRLLAVDPGWTWEPVALTGEGLPALDGDGGLWIRLTVAGVARLGYGDAIGQDGRPKTGPSAVKEAIGDALRNGAMRFGVGLDLWHKDGQLVHDDEPVPVGRGESPQNGQPAGSKDADAARAELRRDCEKNGWDLAQVAKDYSDRYDGEILGTTTNAIRIRAFRNIIDGIKLHAANGSQS